MVHPEPGMRQPPSELQTNACEQNPATDDPRSSICATTGTSWRKPARDVPKSYQPGRRALWKQSQRSKIADENVITELEAVTESSAHSGDDIHIDSDISEMQRSAISCASLLSSRVSLSFLTSSSSPPQSVFPIDGSTSLGGCFPPADEAGIAETGLNQAGSA